MSERAQIAIQAVVVVVVFAAAIAGIVASVAAAPPSISTSPGGPDASLIATTVRSPGPPPTTAAPSAAASPAPTASRQPVTLVPYTSGGRAYTGVQLGAGWTIVAPFDGRIEVHVYQLLNGQLRESTDDPRVPSYPYFVITAPDGRKATYRPGALTTDTQPLVRGSQIRTGDDLFTVIGTGPSSWHDFYDASVTVQVLVSLVTATGADADAAPIVKAR